jgi:uncharacterized membrane protein YhhN
MPYSRISGLYWLLATAYLALNATALAGTPSLMLLKPLPILLLAGMAWYQLAGRWRLAMTLALVFSAIGDVLLALRIEGFDSFVPGLGSFLIAQLIYAALFWSQRQFSRQRLMLAVGYLLIVGMLAWLVLPRTGNLLVPVAFYLLAISAMATGAAFTATPLPWLFVGALTFVLSDSLIALNRFVTAIPAAAVAIMLTYYLAQWLIWYSVLQAGGRKATAVASR